jgi:ribose-phosphate pyrophosphokinase
MDTSFVYPEQFVEEQARRMESTAGQLVIAGCRAGDYMARRVVEQYKALLKEAGSATDVVFLSAIDTTFRDTETGVRLEEHVGGADVFLFQALLSPGRNTPANHNLMSFLIAARAFREHGANRITAVLPYLTYARQDKPTKFQREPTTAKLVADLVKAAGVDRVIAWHPHSNQIHGFYADTPVNMLDPLTAFNEEFAEFRDKEDVIAVAPDAGATKLILHFSREMGINSAIASKQRPRPEEATITDIIGDFRGKRTAIVLDDMIASARTISELVEALVREKGIEEVQIGTSHNLCLPDTRERLEALHRDFNLTKVVVTNSIPQTSEFEELPYFHVRCLSDIFCRTINRVHYNRSVSEVFRSR